MTWIVVDNPCWPCLNHLMDIWLAEQFYGTFAYFPFSCCLLFLPPNRPSLTTFRRVHISRAMITLTVLHFRLPQVIYGNGWNSWRVLFSYVMILSAILL